MELRLSLWVVSYAQIDKNKFLVQDIIGVFAEQGDALKCMREKVRHGIIDGDNPCLWNVFDYHAEYRNPNSEFIKQYNITRL